MKAGHSPSVHGWDRRFVRSGGISQGRESGRALSSERTASRNKHDRHQQGRIEAFWSYTCVHSIYTQRTICIMDHPEFKISYRGSLVFSDDFGELCTCCPPRNDLLSEPSSFLFFLCWGVAFSSWWTYFLVPTLVNSFEHVASSCGLTVRLCVGVVVVEATLSPTQETGVPAFFNSPNESEADVEGGNPLCGLSRSHGAFRDCLPPKVCCRSCRWRRESWCSGRHRNEGRSRGSGSPPLGPCCRCAGESGRSLAWRTCSEK